jgi:hypothetical protein
MKIRGDQFIRIKETPGGFTISLDIQAVQARIPKVNPGGGANLRKAYMIGASGSGYTQDVYLDEYETGDIVECYFLITGANSDLSAAAPLFYDGDRIFVTYNESEARWEYAGGALSSVGDCPE